MRYGTSEARILRRARTFVRKASASDIKGKRNLVCKCGRENTKPVDSSRSLMALSSMHF
jgi:hypothetical protein